MVTGGGFAPPPEPSLERAGRPGSDQTDAAPSGMGWAPGPTATQAPPSTHPLATISLVIGLVGLVVAPGVSGFVAAGLAAAALRAINNEPGRWGGRRAAMGGLVVGLAFSVVPVAAVLAFLVATRHHPWAAVPLAIVFAYGVAVIAAGAQRSRTVLAVSGLGIVAGVVALVMAIVIVMGMSILMALLRDIGTGIKHQLHCDFGSGRGGPGCPPVTTR